jgi:hypothetical protein
LNVATAGDRSQFPPFEKDFVPFAFIRQIIGRHEVKHWRLAATDTSQDQSKVNLKIRSHLIPDMDQLVSDMNRRNVLH